MAATQTTLASGDDDPKPDLPEVEPEPLFTTTGGYKPPPEFAAVRRKVQQHLVNDMKAPARALNPTELRREILPVFNEALLEANLAVSRNERELMMNLIMDDILGYGPIQPLLNRDDINEVMVNGPNRVYVEYQGRLMLTDVKFADDDHVMRVIERIVAPLGRRIDESSPMVDARLPDGSRVNAIIPPLSLVGPCITIRKFKKTPLTIDDLIANGSLTPEFAQFIEAAVVARLNIIVSGGTGSGKTTLLNVLSSYIPSDERIITIEDAAELQLNQDHVVRLEARPPNIEGKGAVTIRDLVINSLRMRPDRIVVGEVRGGEALDMLQAMNTGHDGSITTAHSNSPRDTLSRIETMTLMAGMDLPLRAIRQQIASAIDLIVHVERLRDGSRRVVQCSEVLGMEGDMIVMQDIFVFKQTGIDDKGRVIGRLEPTGLRPRAIDRIEAAGLHLPPNVFGAAGYTTSWKG
ncbi:MAG: CpaF family protein [Chloroflexi bacterium]|nr:CpaF family protein [Chloroflexota bacterium]